MTTICRAGSEHELARSITCSQFGEDDLSDREVLIVGGGLAGLCCARRLHAGGVPPWSPPGSKAAPRLGSTATLLCLSTAIRFSGPGIPPLLKEAELSFRESLLTVGQFVRCVKVEFVIDVAL